MFVKEGTTWTYKMHGEKKNVPTKFYDVTNTIRDIFFRWIEHHGDIDENELYHLTFEDLYPEVIEYPDDDQEVLDIFNENSTKHFIKLYAYHHFS